MIFFPLQEFLAMHHLNANAITAIGCHGQTVYHSPSGTHPFTLQLGDPNVIAAQTGIAGSTVIGDWNQIGGQVGIVGHIKVGSQVKIQAQSGVNGNVEDKEILYGSPAINAGDYRRNYVHFRNFANIVKRIDQLEKNSKDSK